MPLHPHMDRHVDVIKVENMLWTWGSFFRAELVIHYVCSVTSLCPPSSLPAVLLLSSLSNKGKIPEHISLKRTPACDNKHTRHYYLAPSCSLPDVLLLLLNWKANKMSFFVKQDIPKHLNPIQSITSLCLRVSWVGPLEKLKFDARKCYEALDNDLIPLKRSLL